ncbi:MAG: phosphotransferase [Roseibium sp.]
MPHSSCSSPEPIDPEILAAFAGHPVLAEICGQLHGSVPQSGLTNRVFRLSADTGDYFLRLPRAETVGMIDRHAEALNLKSAADQGLALPAVYCAPDSGILLTEAVETLHVLPGDFPRELGAAVGRLHSSGAEFDGMLDPVAVYKAQKLKLSQYPDLLEETGALDRALIPTGEFSNPVDGELFLVPSHGDLSPGNCLATGNKLWLIDWEYSGLSLPAWDLAYAILEHEFSIEEERRFLQGYSDIGANRFLPSEDQLIVMKSRCDAVSALWALEQVARGREAETFRLFAQERMQRALSRLR